MSWALAIALNGALLAALGWAWRHERAHAPAALRRWLLPALLLRVGVGAASTWQPGPDARLMSYWGHEVTKQLWASPETARAVLLSNELHAAGRELINFGGLSNTFFLIKLLGLLNLASHDADWLNAAYLSLFAFGGGWALVRVLASRFPAAPVGAGVTAFLLWPSVVWWAAGIAKETVLLGSGTALAALALGALYPAAAGSAARGPWAGWGRAAGLLLLAWVHFRMRYFFAVPLLGVLAALAALRGAQHLGWARRRLGQALVLAGALAAGAWLAPQLVGPALAANKLTSQLVRVYDHNLANSRYRPHFEYADLRPTAASALRNAPEAVFNTLTRPRLGESAQVLYVVVGLENLLLLGLLGLALLAAVRGRAGRLPFALTLGLVLYVTVLAVLVGLSTPNFGTLHRYRTGLLPWLLLLLLQNDYARAGLRRIGVGGAAG